MRLQPTIPGLPAHSPNRPTLQAWLGHSCPDLGDPHSSAQVLHPPLHGSRHPSWGMTSTPAKATAPQKQPFTGHRTPKVCKANTSDPPHLTPARAHSPWSVATLVPRLLMGHCPAQSPLPTTVMPCVSLGILDLALGSLLNLPAIHLCGLTSTPPLLSSLAASSLTPFSTLRGLPQTLQAS